MRLSLAEYLEVQARLDLKRRGAQPLPVESVEDESDLHCGIIAECKRRTWICLHGSMAHRSHRTVGEPDCIVIADRGRVFFLECKRKGGKPTKEQSAMIAWLTHLGASAHVVYSMAEVVAIFDA